MAQDGVTINDRLRALEDGEAKLRGEIAPTVYAFGAVRPLGRIRAYTSAGLGPFAGRGMPSEFMLLGHVHVDAAGLIVRIEGFNGPEGERWAKKAADVAKAKGLVATDVKVQAATPLRACQHTGIH